jgi:ribose/xylose/arabinose/galactoside ABC-type transport system permease subunit
MFGIRFNEIALVIAILAVLAVTVVLDSNRSYVTNPQVNAVEIGRQTALLGIFALGAMVVIVSGGIDLSAGSMIAFSGAVIACTMLALKTWSVTAGLPEWSIVVLGISAGMFSGFLVGTLHAWLVTCIGLPPFVATLSTLVGLRSLARILCEFTTITAVGSKKAQIVVEQEFFTWFSDPQRVWIWIVILCLLALGTWVLMSWTVLGRHLYAMGGNEQAAKLSGIRTDRLKWFSYVFGAMTASLAGVFYLANEGVSAPVTQGQGHELKAIAAAVVGGCSLQGGVGTVSGALLGALFLRIVIDSVSKIIKTGADIWEGLIVGLVVVIAVTFSQLNQFRASGRKIFPGWMGVWSVGILSATTAFLMLTTKGPGFALAAIPIVVVVLGGWKFIESRGNR